jgi:hypothetical protein
MKTLWLMLIAVLSLAARESLAQRIAHTDPAKYQRPTRVHQGAGQMDHNSFCTVKHRRGAGRSIPVPLFPSWG